MSAFDLHQLFSFFLGAAFLLGLVFGSFLNVCIYRMPLGLSVVAPPSACPQCHAPIRAYDNVPVLSWLLLRGRCRNCKEPISSRYAMVEISVGLLFAICFLRFGLSLDTLKYCVLSFLLTGLIFTDFDTRLLPDLLTLPGLGLGLVFSVFVPVDSFFSMFVPYSFWRHFPSALVPRLESLMDSLTGAMLGSLMIFGAGYVYLKVRGHEGMGFGDVKMMAMVGAFLGVQMTLFTIGGAALVASIFGLGTMLIVWVKRLRRRTGRGREALGRAIPRAWSSATLVYRNYEIPFGSFLGCAALVLLFCGDGIIRWYLRLWIGR